MKVDLDQTRALREKFAQERAERKEEVKRIVRYLSEEWQKLCEDAINSDTQFAQLAGDMTIELNNIIESCPDGKTRFIYWRFESGKLVKTVVGEIGEMGDLKPFFTTLATYDTFMKINTAKLSVEAAVINGLLRFEGDLAGMMSYADALNRFTEVRRTITTEY
jgi:putative sterol carrier protein